MGNSRKGSDPKTGKSISKNESEANSTDVIWIEGDGQELIEGSSDFMEAEQTLLGMIESDGDGEDGDSSLGKEKIVLDNLVHSTAVSNTIDRWESERRRRQRQRSKACPWSWKSGVMGLDLVGSVIEQFTRKWKNRCRAKKVHQMTKLALRFYEEVKTLWGDDIIPADIQVILEVFCWCDSTGMSLSSPIPFSPATDFQNILDQLNFKEVKAFHSVMNSCIKLNKEMDSIIDFFRAKMDVQCFIGSTEPHHELLLDFAHELKTLRTRLSMIQSVVGNKLKNLYKDVNVTDALKMRYMSCPEVLCDLDSYLMKDIPASVVKDLMDASHTTSTILIKSVATVALYYTLCTSDTESFPDVDCLMTESLLGDVKVVVTTGISNLVRSVANFEEDVERKRREREQLERDNLNRLISFSKESKLYRCCQSSLERAQELMSYLDFIRSESLRLADTLSPEEYKEIREILVGYQEAAWDILKKLESSMDTQMLMIMNLKKTNPSHQETSKEEKHDDVDTPELKHPEENDGSGDHSEVKREEDKLVYLINSGAGEEDFESEPATQRDEVFIGVFGHDDLTDCSSQTLGNPEGDNVDKKLHKKLYSGVVTQLKTALVPVKETMKQREKEAVTKRFGKAEADEKENEGSVPDEDDDEEYYQSPVGSDNGEKRNGRKFCRLKPEGVDQEDLKFGAAEEFGSCESLSGGGNDKIRMNEFAPPPPDFMKELKMKLGGEKNPGAGEEVIVANGNKEGAETDED